MWIKLVRKTWPLAILMLVTGCSDPASHVAREAADRQAQQNSTMAELHQEVAEGSRRLVEADAQARTEMVAVHRDLQAERTRLDEHLNDLEQQRQQMARDRRTESMLLPVVQLVGGGLLVALLLAFCWQVLVATRHEDANDSLQELLIGEVLGDRHSTLSSLDSRRRLDQLPVDDQ